MTNYPYYILVYFDAGILRKVFNDKKFKCYNDCINAYDKLKNNPNKKNFFKRQLIILEYTDQYEGKIVTIFNGYVTHYIANPVKND